MKAKRQAINYYFTTMIERGGGTRRYSWRRGYSPKLEGELLYPSITYRECQRDAKALGRRAVFVRDGCQMMTVRLTNSSVLLYVGDDWGLVKGEISNFQILKDFMLDRRLIVTLPTIIITADPYDGETKCPTCLSLICAYCQGQDNECDGRHFFPCPEINGADNR